MPRKRTDFCFTANTIVQMYGLTHPSFEAKQWHVFVTYIIATWLACLIVCLFNSAMPHLNTAGIFFLIAGFLIIVIVVYVSRDVDYSGRGPNGCPEL